MGLIQAFTGSIGGAFAEQWIDFISPPPTLDETVIIARGERVGKNKGNNNVITNGSKILVPEGMAAVFFENGQITNFVSQAGGYEFTTENLISKSIFTGGGVIDSLAKNTFERFKFGGQPGASQIVLYVNMKHLNGMKYGTANPIRYQDGKYGGAMLAVTSFGNYSMRIVDPMLLLKNLVPSNVIMGQVPTYDFVNGASAETLRSQVVGSLATALSKYTKGGKTIDDIQAGTTEFADCLSKIIEENYNWSTEYGLELLDIQPRSLDWDDKSIMQIEKFTTGMLMQGSVGESYARTQVAEGLNAAGNSGGGGAGMFGIGMAGNAIGGMGLFGGAQAPAAGNAEVSRVPPAPQSPDDRIAKLKGYLDAGTISQAQYDAKVEKILEEI